jgi:hypothetical protein
LNLPQEQQEQIIGWLFTPGLRGKDIKRLIKSEMDINTSEAAISDFWDKIAAPVLIARRAKAVKLADDYGNAMESTPGRFDQATIGIVKQRIFQLASDPTADTKELALLLNLVLKAQANESAATANELKARDVNLREKTFQRETCELFIKWYADERAKSIVEGPGDNDAKREKLGQMLFGEEW